MGPPAPHQQAVFPQGQPLHTDSDPQTTDLAPQHQEPTSQRACSAPQDADPAVTQLADQAKPQLVDAASPQLTEPEKFQLADLTNPQPAEPELSQLLHTAPQPIDPVLSGQTGPVPKIEPPGVTLQQDGGGSPRAIGARRRKPQRMRHLDTQQVEHATGEGDGRARLGVSDPEVSGESDGNGEVRPSASHERSEQPFKGSRC